MGWILGLIVAAVVLKVLWIVLLFAAPVLIPLVIVVGGFAVVVVTYHTLADAVEKVLRERDYRRRLRQAGAQSVAEDPSRSNL